MDTMLRPLKTGFFPGDHIRARRRWGCWRHGILTTNHRVIRLDGSPFISRNARVVETSLEEFAGGGPIERVNYRYRYTARTAIDRARSRLGEEQGSALFNCSRHFARWCAAGNALDARACATDPFLARLRVTLKL